MSDYALLSRRSDHCGESRGDGDLATTRASARHIGPSCPLMQQLSARHRVILRFVGQRSGCRAGRAALAGAMAGCQAILLGRTTYEMFEPAWSARTGAEDPGAPFMNDTMKYVISSTLEKATWRNSEIAGPYDANVIRQLKERVPGAIYVSGSGTLVRAMLADGLVDELHLFVYPLTLGSGPRLFDGTPAGKFALANSEVYDNGVLYLRYHTAT